MIFNLFNKEPNKEPKTRNELQEMSQKDLHKYAKLLGINPKYSENLISDILRAQTKNNG